MLHSIEISNKAQAAIDAFDRLLEITRADYVATMEVYFDESGTHAASPVVCVAGYLFSTEQARQLNREWADTLERFGVSYFHSAECGNGHGEFGNLTREQRNDLTKAVIGIVKRRMEVGFSVTVSETDFHQIKPPIWIKGSPSLICAMYVLSGVSGWCEKNSFDGDIAYFFEAGDEHQGSVCEAIRELSSHPVWQSGFRYSSHSFIKKPMNGPLQAADLLAYEWYREICRLNDPNNTRPSRRSFDALLGHPGYYATHFTASDLHRFMTRDREFMLERFGKLDKVQSHHES